MIAPLKSLLDPKTVALARARFHAWWEGEAYDPSAAEADFAAAQEAAAAAAEQAEAEADADVELDPRLEALSKVWGADRVGPGDPADEQAAPALLALPATGRLALFGPGLAAPIVAAAGAHPGDFTVYEWREETLDSCRRGVRHAKLSARVKCEPMDLDLFSAPAEAWDGAWSFDEFTYAPNPARLAQQIARGLKPGAAALVDAYVGGPDPQRQSSFATAFSEPHVAMDGDIVEAFSTAGLTLEHQESLTAAHCVLAKAGFQRLAEALAASEGLAPMVAREIAWEAEAWRARLAALSSGRLERVRFLFRRSA